MQRIPEPELMDDPAQARAYAEADFSEPHQAFVEHFRRRFPAFAGGRVIDLGCGPADVTIRFARAFPGTTLLGVDAAAPMLAFGRRAVKRAGLAARIRLARRRLPDPSLPGGFDAVISNSLLHHLDDPGVLWRTVRQVGRAGAAVLIMDLMRPATEAELERLVAVYAADAPDVLCRDFRNSLRAAYRPDEVRAQLAEAGLAGFSVEAVSDRHLLAWGTGPG
ncbi:class I SAM-dependent methyltransferase [Pelomicrobium methylotrophicum]|uniref:Methyltransferase domain-containing protein n=1 Tax=Pelomicrobium methylotrophicum TaxID=2602750 RepID=A0A5C7ETD3_9PROT|nr:class I SAM-dependent methyltransferase [Pelomicrobium methylotrophicum]TXF10393.1 methyltransferase domain-containing protein [Pelomicrobium methylotrophicum]